METRIPITKPRATPIETLIGYIDRLIILDVFSIQLKNRFMVYQRLMYDISKFVRVTQTFLGGSNKDSPKKIDVEGKNRHDSLTWLMLWVLLSSLSKRNLSSGLRRTICIQYHTIEKMLATEDWIIYDSTTKNVMSIKAIDPNTSALTCGGRSGPGGLGSFRTCRCPDANRGCCEQEIDDVVRYMFSNLRSTTCRSFIYSAGLAWMATRKGPQ